LLGDATQYYSPNYTGDGYAEEAQLDTQMMAGIAPGAKMCFWMIGEWMYEFAREYLAAPNPPSVGSLSYGWWEEEQCIENSTGIVDCSQIGIPNSHQYVNRTSIEFAKLGLMGITLVVASGDSGVSGTHGSLNNCESPNEIFPATSPFVTAVGGTSVETSSHTFKITNPPPICTNSQQYNCACTTSLYEQPCQANNSAGFDSGGGFSAYFPMPAYQKAAVTGYLKSGVWLPSSSMYNWNNRAFPDIAAVGSNVCILELNSQCNMIGGTSAATPLFSALVTLFNQDRLNAGKSTLGFVNPLIYKMYSLNRNTYYNSNITGGPNDGGCPGLGFIAVPGWNPVTGVGSPNFGAMRQYIATLP